MGDVHRAICPEGPFQGKALALKRYHLPFSRDPAFRAAFFKGAQGAAGRIIPGVSPLLEVGEVDGILYTLRPYLPGSSLRALLDHVKAVGGVVSPGLAVGCVLQLAEAMKGIQRGGSKATNVHGCLKPENILIDSQGVCTILEYGTAGPLKWGRTELWWLDPKALPYLPPETLDDREAEQQFDVFSLGALLVECLTLSPPFHFTSPLDAIDGLRRLDLAPLRARLEDSGFERELIDLIEWSLDPDPGRRLEDSGLFHTYLSEQLPGALGGPGADVFWGELITELQGLEDEAPPPADGIWSLMLIDGRFSSAIAASPLDSLPLKGSPWGRDDAAFEVDATPGGIIAPLSRGAADPIKKGADAEAAGLGLVLGALAEIKSGKDLAQGAEGSRATPMGSAPIPAAPVGGDPSPPAPAASIAPSVGEISQEGSPAQAGDAITYNADEIAYDGADEIAYESGDGGYDDDEGFEGESQDEGEFAGEAVYSVGDDGGDILMFSGEDGEDSEEEESEEEDSEGEYEDDDDDSPAVVAMGDGLFLEDGSAFLDESESETEAVAFEDAERAFFADGAEESDVYDAGSAGVTLALGGAPDDEEPEDSEDEDDHFEGEDDDFEDDDENFEDDDEDIDGGDIDDEDNAEVVVALGDGNAGVAALGGILGVGERVDLSAILGGDDPEPEGLEGVALPVGSADDDEFAGGEAVILAVGDDGSAGEIQAVEGADVSAQLKEGGTLAFGEEAGAAKASGDDQGDDELAPSEEDMAGGIVAVSGGDSDAADLPEPVMLPPKKVVDEIIVDEMEEESPPEEAKVNFSDRQTVQMSKAQIQSILASGDVDSLSQRQRAVLESLQSLDGEASPLGLSDIFSAFSRPKDASGTDDLPQAPQDVEAMSGDGEAARIEGLLSTSTRRRRSGALPEGTVLEGQLKIVRRIEVGPYRALYEAVAAPEALTRRCWECGYAHNTRDDRRCYRCRRPLGRRRFCVSARWDRRLVGYDLELIRGGLAHGAVDPIYGWLVHEGQLCRVMELRGDEFLAMISHLAPSQAHGIALSLCDALTYLCSIGVSLRELLPSQVVVIEGGALLYDPEVGGVEGGPLRGAALSRAAELIGRLLVLMIPPGQSPLGDILSEATAGRFSSPEGLKGALLALEERDRSAQGA